MNTLEPNHLPHNELLTVRSQHVYARFKGTGHQLIVFDEVHQDHLLFRRFPAKAVLSTMMTHEARPNSARLID